MTILGRGDLSPPRRYRPGARRRWPRALLVLLVLAAAGAGGWFGWQRWSDDNTASVRTTPTPCVTTASATASPVVTSGPPITVLNGNLRPGLAADVARGLRRRFHVQVSHVGNAAAFLKGTSLVRYPDRLATQADRIAAMVVPAPRLVVAADASRVELDLGTKFDRVASTAEFERATAPSVTPAATSPSAAGCTPS